MGKKEDNENENESKKNDKGKNEDKDVIDGLDSAMAVIRKRFGKTAIIRGEIVLKDVEAVSSGSMALDIALGIGGFPRGRISEIFGAEGSGKTTLALETIACTQKAGGVAAFIDAEHALDVMYARNLGVNMDTLMMSQPDSGEEALSIVEILAKSNAVDVIVVDSVAGLVPQAELDSQFGDQHIAAQARLMSTALRRMKGTINTSRTALIFVNQLREKAGMSFGNPEVTPGGRALKFYASVRVDLKRVSVIKVGEDSIGHIVRAAVIKNKVAMPFKKADFEIYYGKGISVEADVINIGSECGMISKTGSWYTYNDAKIGNGKQAVIDFLSEHQDIMNELKEMILDTKLPIRMKGGEEDGNPSPKVEC